MRSLDKAAARGEANQAWLRAHEREREHDKGETPRWDGVPACAFAAKSALPSGDPLSDGKTAAVATACAVVSDLAKRQCIQWLCIQGDRARLESEDGVAESQEQTLFSAVPSGPGTLDAMAPWHCEDEARGTAPPVATAAPPARTAPSALSPGPLNGVALSPLSCEDGAADELPPEAAAAHPSPPPPLCEDGAATAAPPEAAAAGALAPSEADAPAADVFPGCGALPLSLSLHEDEAAEEAPLGAAARGVSRLLPAPLLPDRMAFSCPATPPAREEDIGPSLSLASASASSQSPMSVLLKPASASASQSPLSGLLKPTATTSSPLSAGCIPEVPEEVSSLPRGSLLGRGLKAVSKEVQRRRSRWEAAGGPDQADRDRTKRHGGKPLRGAGGGSPWQSTSSGAHHAAPAREARQPRASTWPQDPGHPERHPAGAPPPRGVPAPLGAPSRGASLLAAGLRDARRHEAKRQSQACVDGLAQTCPAASSTAVPDSSTAAANTNSSPGPRRERPSGGLHDVQQSRPQAALGWAEHREGAQAQLSSPPARVPRPSPVCAAAHPGPPAAQRRRRPASAVTGRPAQEVLLEGAHLPPPPGRGLHAPPRSAPSRAALRGSMAVWAAAAVAAVPPGLATGTERAGLLRGARPQPVGGVFSVVGKDAG
ncbi:unnamed protein product [Prorocentrum cordatum]|uniref:Uncharacterized protein n=1 Tax=Prorocentrum cordatum TaxID=2364126 RepID=A0ABN9TME9_9DINO|nr:unnamed protein product [Polarella glacialis]